MCLDSLFLPLFSLKSSGNAMNAFCETGFCITKQKQQSVGYNKNKMANGDTIHKANLLYVFQIAYKLGSVYISVCVVFIHITKYILY